MQLSMTRKGQTVRCTSRAPYLAPPPDRAPCIMSPRERYVPFCLPCSLKLSLALRLDEEHQWGMRWDFRTRARLRLPDRDGFHDGAGRQSRPLAVHSCGIDAQCHEG